MALQNSVTFLIPCLNEELTIVKVITEIRSQLPTADILVIDNSSTDNTQIAAKNAGVRVIVEPRKGKGFATLAGLRGIDTDIVVILDGDLTYDLSTVKAFIDAISNGFDMVVGNRIATQASAYRPAHTWGNRAFSMFQQRILRVEVTDVFSGYRAMSRSFYKSIVFEAKGFEIETELNVYSAIINAQVLNIDSNYRPRPESSVSKLNTYRDGMKILGVTLKLFRIWRPSIFFGLTGSIIATVSLMIFYFPLSEYLQTGLVSKIPTLVASFIGILTGIIFFLAGVTGQLIIQSRIESNRAMFNLFKFLGTNKK
jgi:glycosyltransferase involved in cell wall biosynthesis